MQKRAQLSKLKSSHLFPGADSGAIYITYINTSCKNSRTTKGKPAWWFVEGNFDQKCNALPDVASLED